MFSFKRSSDVSSEKLGAAPKLPPNVPMPPPVKPAPKVPSPPSKPPPSPPVSAVTRRPATPARALVREIGRRIRIADATLPPKFRFASVFWFALSPLPRPVSTFEMPDALELRG